MHVVNIVPLHTHSVEGKVSGLIRLEERYNKKRKDVRKLLIFHDTCIIHKDRSLEDASKSLE